MTEIERRLIGAALLLAGFLMALAGACGFVRVLAEPRRET